jgi:N6-L-threonylcarbamoyladenine synthase
MLVLGIESSCDETAIALIERGHRNCVIAECIKSQIPLHTGYGGVVPEIASRSHFETVDGLLNELLNESRLDLKDIDMVSATQGPGLIGSLLIGFMFGKTLAYTIKKPFVPVNHIDAHLDAVAIESEPVRFPALGLVVSGGHTTLYLMNNRYERMVLSKTRDDAVGEVMDKVSKYFGLGYPGGPILDRLTDLETAETKLFSTPKMSDGSMDFSFSGYKTAVMRHAQKRKLDKNHPEFRGFITSFCHDVVDYLISMIDHFARIHLPQTIIISGGVSRNSLLRHKAASFFSDQKVIVRFPSPQYCTDNASMVAWRAYDLFTTFPERDYFQYNLTPFSRVSPNRTSKHR